jgi:hypothetical protein
MVCAQRGSVVIQGRFSTPPTRLAAAAPGRGVQAAGIPTAGGVRIIPLPPHLAVFGERAEPLPPAVLAKMESFFRADFRDVRIHVGAEAHRLGALAFTRGSHIFFAHGQYNPHTPAGQQLLGHELAHVQQQRAGRVRTPLAPGVSTVQDPLLEAEAERSGRMAAAHQPSPPRRAGGRPALLPFAPGGVALQPAKRRRGEKEEDDEEEEPAKRKRGEKEEDDDEEEQRELTLSERADAVFALLGDNQRANAATTIAFASAGDQSFFCSSNDVSQISREAQRKAKALGAPGGVVKSGAGFHAEMWMVIEALELGDTEETIRQRIRRVGASRKCCKYCSAILKVLKIPVDAASGSIYKSWVNPLTTGADSRPRPGLPGQRKSIPDFRQHSLNYWWTGDGTRHTRTARGQ